MDNYALISGREEQNIYSSRRQKSLKKKRVNIVLSALLMDAYDLVLVEINQTGQRKMKQKAKRRRRRRRRRRKWAHIIRLGCRFGGGTGPLCQRPCLNEKAKAATKVVMSQPCKHPSGVWPESSPQSLISYQGAGMKVKKTKSKSVSIQSQGKDLFIWNPFQESESRWRIKPARSRARNRKCL